MFGIALAIASTFCEEAANSIGKKEVRERVASFYTFGFLSLLFGTVIFILEGLVRHSLFFSVDSLPTLVPRLGFEILQAYVTVRAITVSDRGDFGLVKSLTIPLLLAIDIALHYAVGGAQVIGMVLIVAPIALLLYQERRQVRGLKYLLIGAVNAAVTISLFKYDITHFNSVEAEQAIVGLVLMGYFFCFAFFKERENPFHFLRIKAFAWQTLASGLASITAGFAYLFAPASVILALLRSSAVLFAILTGRFYFHERHFLVRTVLFFFVAAGLILLIPR